MNVYKISDNTVVESEVLPNRLSDAELFVICNANEVPSIMNVFGWDESSTLESVNIDETVRYTSYSGYDFSSIIYVEEEKGSVQQREVNLFFSKNYLVLVLPNSKGTRLARLIDRLRRAITNAVVRQSPLTYIYYLIFNGFVSDFSDTLEILEDELEALAEMIVEKPSHEQIVQIGRLRKTAYTHKKMLRALSYSGEQIQMDENQLLDDGNVNYFRNIDTRLMKLYDFAKSLYDLSNDLLQTYDSKFSAQMSETVNKLAAITLIFGPLTVISGIYGMNFDNMPELKWPLGYPFALGIMAAVGIGIFFILKKKKWL